MLVSSSKLLILLILFPFPSNEFIAKLEVETFCAGCTLLSVFISALLIVRRKHPKICCLLQ